MHFISDCSPTGVSFPIKYVFSQKLTTMIKKMFINMSWWLLRHWHFTLGHLKTEMTYRSKGRKRKSLITHALFGADIIYSLFLVAQQSPLYSLQFVSTNTLSEGFLCMIRRKVIENGCPQQQPSTSKNGGSTSSLRCQ